jgi:DNA-binding beta-propeller fold protein YncE
MGSSRHPSLLALTALLALSACSSGGSGTPPPAELTYTTSTAIYRTNYLITANAPTSTGGAVASYAVSPALPADLSLDATTGVISGTPKAAKASATYTVTASNAGGAATAALTIAVDDADPPQDLPNMGTRITPLAPPEATFDLLQPGSAMVLDPATLPSPEAFLAVLRDWAVGQAVSSVVSPDKNTLLVLTSGYNQVWGMTARGPAPVNTSEWVFVYDVSAGPPVFKQALPLPNAYNGIAFDPVAPAFYVSGGMGNPRPDNLPDRPAGDQIYVFAQDALSGQWEEQLPSLALGHREGLGLNVPDSGPTPVNSAVYMQPTSAGLALTQDGQALVVANYSNDSVTVFTGGFGNWVKAAEQDLRPGLIYPKDDAADPRIPGDQSSTGVPGGEYPFWVAVTGTSVDDARVFVSSLRDREIVVLNLKEVLDPASVFTSNGAPRVVARLKTRGQPNKMTLNAAQTRLYVVEEQADQVSIIDTGVGLPPPATPAAPAVKATIPIIAPPEVLALLPTTPALRTGANPTSVTLSPDESQLWVTNGNHNAVAVVSLAGDTGQVTGLIPTGWYPNAVTFSPDGQWASVINQKSPTGANLDFCYSSAPLPPHHPHTCWSANEYNPQTTKAGLQTFRVPDAQQLAALTAQVAVNNRFAARVSPEDEAVLAAVRGGIKHVIFVIKENRTYDQILGDSEIEGSDGDPGLADFGKAITPNQNALAKGFVTLDRFLDTAEVSNDGWPWTTGARAPDTIERNFAVIYAGRGLTLESEGLNRAVNVALPTLKERLLANPLTPPDPDLLPGQASVAAPDGPNNEVGTGYLWDSALRAGLTVRNYGFFLDTTLYAPSLAPVKAIPLAHDPAATGTRVAFPASVSLAPHTDPYFRGFDNNFPDYYRYTEWARDFDAQPLANLSLVRFMHDHTGNFGTAIDLVNTPELQVADNDYAVGLLVEKVAASQYAKDTLIFIIEDDAQDGGDHVDSHRSVAFVVGPYVKQGAVVSTQYNTLDFVRTIEEVLGLPPLNLNDALAKPMADVFTTAPQPWSFKATPSAYLYNTRLPLPPKPPGLVVPATTRDAAYWAKVTSGMDFAVEDQFDFATYNRILWKGLRGDVPYPEVRSGLDLRKNRAELLAKHRAAKAK